MIKGNEFLGATKHLYNWLCPLVGRLVGWLVGRVTHLGDNPHVAPYWPTWPCFYIYLPLPLIRWDKNIWFVNFSSHIIGANLQKCKKKEKPIFMTFYGTSKQSIEHLCILCVTKKLFRFPNLTIILKMTNSLSTTQSPNQCLLERDLAIALPHSLLETVF